MNYITVFFTKNQCHIDNLYIDDLPAIYNTKVAFHLDKPVKKVTLVPQMTELAFEQNGKDIGFVVDEFSCHQLISIAY